MNRCKKSCEKKDRERYDMLRKDWPKGIPPLPKKSNRIVYNECMSESCNPGCKDTLFEEIPEGRTTQSSQEIDRLAERLLIKTLQAVKAVNSTHRKKQTKEDKRMMDAMTHTIKKLNKKTRKEIIKESGGKILNQDSFYRKMSAPKGLSRYKKTMNQYKKTMKKRGALSGCIRYVFQ